MTDLTDPMIDLRRAETAVRSILDRGGVGERMMALFKLYEAGDAGERQALVSVLAARVALATRPSSSAIAR